MERLGPYLDHGILQLHNNAAERGMRAIALGRKNDLFVGSEAGGKAQIDWIPLPMGAIRPTQGKTLAVMQVSGGSQSFNAVNQMRVLGRWMQLIIIPNQSSIPKVFPEFDEAGRMRPSPLYDRIVDVMEELMKFTLLTRDRADCLVDRYSERKETAEAVMKRVNLSQAI